MMSIKLRFQAFCLKQIPRLQKVVLSPSGGLRAQELRAWVGDQEKKIHL